VSVAVTRSTMSGRCAVSVAVCVAVGVA